MKLIPLGSSHRIPSPKMWKKSPAQQGNSLVSKNDFQLNSHWNPMEKSYKIQLKSHENLIIPSKSHKKPLVDQDGEGSDDQPQPPASQRPPCKAGTPMVAKKSQISQESVQVWLCLRKEGKKPPSNGFLRGKRMGT